LAPRKLARHRRRRRTRSTRSVQSPRRSPASCWHERSVRRGSIFRTIFGEARHPVAAGAGGRRHQRLQPLLGDLSRNQRWSRASGEQADDATFKVLPGIASAIFKAARNNEPGAVPDLQLAALEADRRRRPAPALILV
jgi:hypothetical protein